MTAAGYAVHVARHDGHDRGQGRAPRATVALALVPHRARRRLRARRARPRGRRRQAPRRTAGRRRRPRRAPGTPAGSPGMESPGRLQDPLPGDGVHAGRPVARLRLSSRLDSAATTAGARTALGPAPSPERAKRASTRSRRRRASSTSSAPSHSAQRVPGASRRAAASRPATHRRPFFHRWWFGLVSDAPAGRELSGRHDVFSSAVGIARRGDVHAVKKTSGGPDGLAGSPRHPWIGKTGCGITRTAGAVPVDIGLFRQRSETTSPEGR